MAISDVVDLLVDYLQREDAQEGAAPGNLGDPVLSDLADFIQAQLEQHTGFITLWQEFRSNPSAGSAELTGALEAIVEAEPQVNDRIDAYIDEYDDLTSSGPEDEGFQAEVIDRDTEETGASHLDVTDQVDEYYEGEYMYGETRRGTESEGREIGLQEDDSGGLDEDAADLADLGMHTERIPGVFTRASIAVDDHPDLTQAEKDEIHARLEDLAAQLALDEEANMTHVRQNLAAIQALSPDIYTVLMSEEGLQDYLEDGGEPGYIEGPPGQV